MNNSKILQILQEFIQFKSISTNPKYATELQNTAEFLKNKLLSLGCEVFLQEKEGIPPLIIARKTVPSAQTTLGIYGHYDVQPEDPVSEWNTDPFTLTTQNGKLFARGVADNKGHIVQNISAIEALMHSESLKSNIVFIFEGEEETGSEHFEKLINSSHDLLKDIDVFYITDTNMRAKNKPIIYYSLRGYVGYELKLTIGERDLHSGVYGNQVYNPAQIAIELFAKIKDSRSGRILIPGFYEGIREFSQDELELLNKVGATDEELLKDTGVKKLLTQDGQPTHILPKILPSCDIGGMISGYTDAGVKNIIPRSATVKFSFRLVEYQDPQKKKKLIEDFIAHHIPEGVDYELKNYGSDSPFYTDINNEYMKKTAEIMTKHFGNETVFDREGASIPAAEILSRIFGKPIIITGFVPPGENMHAPNENYDEEMFWSGIEALNKIYAEV